MNDKRTPQLPAEVAEVALLDIDDVRAAVRMSKSWIFDATSRGEFPQPVRFGSRCTRWTANSIRQYLIERSVQPQPEIAAHTKARAKKASSAAQAKRVQAPGRAR